MAIQVSPKRYDVDMTTGSVVRHLLSFSLPYLLGSLFQQFYNLVDTWVVGNYVSSAAFSERGVSNSTALSGWIAAAGGTSKVKAAGTHPFSLPSTTVRAISA